MPSTFACSSFFGLVKIAQGKAVYQTTEWHCFSVCNILFKNCLLVQRYIGIFNGIIGELP